MKPRLMSRKRGEKTSPVSARRNLQSGQSMVLIGLMMIVFIAMLAVILDGGYAYVQRRNAQTAADAGAMAGARELCLTGNPTIAIDAAIDYAIIRNRALEADVVVLGGEVEVTTRIPFATFFGSILGRPSITSSAIAAANCFAPSRAEGILPIAWHCPPDNIELDTYGNQYCDFQTYDGVGDPDISELYIIMNSRKVGEEDDPFCMLEGPVNCDLDGDGDEELLVGGNRSWLDLSGGGGGAAELVDWIENGFPDDVNMHTWYAGQSGVANNIFLTIETGLPFILPVFDAVSVGEPTSPQLHAGDTIVSTSGTWTNYFHVISFSIFVPTCVHATGGSSCELYDLYRDEGYLGPNDKTIEGYFVNGSVVGLGGQGELDAGAFTLYLTR